MFYGLDEDEFDYEAQWKSDPTNQEYFQLYVSKSDRKVAEWRDKVLNLASSIDLENSYYDYWTATGYTESSSERYDRSHKGFIIKVNRGCITRVILDSDGDTKTVWEINVKQKFNEALECIKRAGQQSKNAKTNKPGFSKVLLQIMIITRFLWFDLF